MTELTNTEDLPENILKEYISKLQASYTHRYNEKGIFAPTKLFLGAINSFIDKGLNKEIELELPPTLTKPMIISGCLLLFYPGIQKTDLMHILNISLRCIGEPQIKNIHFDRFWGWLEIFFEPQIKLR